MSEEIVIQELKDRLTIANRHIEDLRGQIMANERYIDELRNRLKAKSTPWRVLRKLKQGHYLKEMITAVHQGPDGVEVVIQ